MVGWNTLWTDIVGLWHLLLGKKNTATIWVCTGNFNRSDYLLKHLIPSMNAAQNHANLALCVADCGSTDVDNLEQRIQELWKGTLVFDKQPETFARAKVFNRAIRLAQGDAIFVCDTDMELPVDIVSQIQKHLTAKTAFFPICQWQLNAETTDWKWFPASTGMFAACKTHLLKTGVLDEKYTTWGKEDWDLFFRFYQAGIMPYRKKVHGLYHHWHASLQPADYTNMF